MSLGSVLGGGCECPKYRVAKLQLPLVKKKKREKLVAEVWDSNGLDWNLDLRRNLQGREFEEWLILMDRLENVAFHHLEDSLILKGKCSCK